MTTLLWLSACVLAAVLAVVVAGIILPSAALNTLLAALLITCVAGAALLWPRRPRTSSPPYRRADFDGWDDLPEIVIDAPALVAPDRPLLAGPAPGITSEVQL